MCLFIMCSIIPCIFSFVGDPQDVSPIVLFQIRCFLYRYKKHGCFLYRLGYEPVEKQKAHLPFCFLHAARTGVSQKTKQKELLFLQKKLARTGLKLWRKQGPSRKKLALISLQGVAIEYQLVEDSIRSLATVRGCSRKYFF